MSYHEDLLEQARHLATREPRKPKQVSLRRAVSASYYAVFHLLTAEGAKMFVPEEKLRALVQRVFSHGDMKDACKMVTQRNLPDAIKPFGPVPADLVQFAKTFIELQEKRHSADYDLALTFTRTQTLDAVARAEDAVNAWQTSIRVTPVASVFLASLVFGKRWNR